MSLIKPPSVIPEWNFEDEKDKTFKFLSTPHEYYHRDTRFWSPSGVFLDVRYVNDKYYTEESRYRGSYVHHTTHLIDEKDTGIWKKIHHEYLGFVEAYCEWKEVWRFKPRLIETPIYHPQYHYGVTPDREGLILDGDEAIIELKTGTMPWWTKIQTAAQDMALHAWDKDKRKTRRRIGVELKANGKFRAKEFDDESDYQTWQGNLITSRAHHREPPPKLTELLAY
jgi:hypothetical protein